MMFDCNASSEAHTFKMTWKAYKQTLKRDCSKPCEQINPHSGTGLGPEHDTELASYDLCDVCGIDGNMILMTRCGCCEQSGLETVACLTCIPMEQLQWIKADEERHHWRCKRCRVGNVRPAFGSIFEDISKPLLATGPAPPPSVLAAALPTTHAASQQLHAAAQARPAATHEAHVLNLADSDSGSDGSYPYQPHTQSQRKQSGPSPRRRSGRVSKPPTAFVAAPHRQPRRRKQTRHTLHRGTLTAAPSDQAPAATLPAAATAAMPPPAPLQAAESASLSLPAAGQTTGSVPVVKLGSAAMPSTIAEIVGMINNQLTPAQQGHYITHSQAAQLQMALGDVKLLLGLLGADDSSLNEVLQADCGLGAMQVVAMRRCLHVLRQ